MIRPLIALLVGLSAHAAAAEVPRVAVDILPVHSLVARVMQGVGTPDLIVTAGATPHDYAMRPSQAAALANADLVVWVGADLTPWLKQPLENLVRRGDVIELLALPETKVLSYRSGVLFDEVDHDHPQETNFVDPHAWLDPQNGVRWLKVIAQALSEKDPDNAKLYAANAKAGQAELKATSARIATLLKPFQDTPFFVFHDAFHYFETRFGLFASGAISAGDASPPGPARLSEIRQHIANIGDVCVFAEPPVKTGLINAVAAGSKLDIAVLNPLGVGLEPGPLLYRKMLEQMAKAIADCRK